MSFDESVILDVTVTPRDAEVVVAWHTSAPAGTVYQVYQDSAHVWTGKSRRCVLPRKGGRTRYHVGAVNPDEKNTDFSASLSLPPGGGQRITLQWEGGTFLDPDIAGFRVYLGTVPGGTVNYATPVDTIAAYGQGTITDGWGQGGFGLGSWGFASGSYSWTSVVLATGTWNAAVVPFNKYGNPGSPVTASQSVAGPPNPIPRGPTGGRVSYLLVREPAGGFGAGGWGSGGLGANDGWGLGGFGGGDFVTGDGDADVFARLSWMASP